MEDFFEVEKKDSRQKIINAMDIGDTIAIARRVEMQYGFAEGAITKHHLQLKGSLGCQVDRTRKRFKDREYKTESGSFMTKEGSLIIVATVTRTA